MFGLYERYCYKAFCSCANIKSIYTAPLDYNRITLNPMDKRESDPVNSTKHGDQILIKYSVVLYMWWMSEYIIACDKWLHGVEVEGISLSSIVR